MSWMPAEGSRAGQGCLPQAQKDSAGRCFNPREIERTALLQSKKIFLKKNCATFYRCCNERICNSHFPWFLAERSMQTKIELRYRIAFIKCLGPTFSSSPLSCLIYGRSLPACPGTDFGSLWVMCPQFVFCWAVQTEMANEMMCYEVPAPAGLPHSSFAMAMLEYSPRNLQTLVKEHWLIWFVLAGA